MSLVRKHAAGFWHDYLGGLVLGFALLLFSNTAYSAYTGLRPLSGGYGGFSGVSRDGDDWQRELPASSSEQLALRLFRSESLGWTERAVDSQDRRFRPPDGTTQGYYQDDGVFRPIVKEKDGFGIVYPDGADTEKLRIHKQFRPLEKKRPLTYEELEHQRRMEKQLYPYSVPQLTNPPAARGFRPLWP